jgi:hypothetical protein
MLLQQSVMHWRQMNSLRCVSLPAPLILLFCNSICPEQNNVASFDINENIPHLSCCHWSGFNSRETWYESFEDAIYLCPQRYPHCGYRLLLSSVVSANSSVQQVKVLENLADEMEDTVSEKLQYLLTRWALLLCSQLNSDDGNMTSFKSEHSKACSFYLFSATARGTFASLCCARILCSMFRYPIHMS